MNDSTRPPEDSHEEIHYEAGAETMSWLDRLSDEHIRALTRVAKHPTKGAYPFFRSPRTMIELRENAEKRTTRNAR